MNEMNEVNGIRVIRDESCPEGIAFIGDVPRRKDGTVDWITVLLEAKRAVETGEELSWTMLRVIE